MNKLKDFKLSKGGLYWITNFLLLLLGKAMARNELEEVKYLSTYFFIAGVVMFIVKVSAILSQALIQYLKQRKE